MENAIEIYEKEIAGRPIETNIDAIVDAALARAKTQVDRGQSRLARATLRKAAEEMRREEEERRERYVAGATLLYNRERDIALASYDGEAAAEAIVGAGRNHSRGERGGDRDVPEFGSGDALRHMAGIAAATCISSP